MSATVTGIKYVRKRPLSAEANAHVDSMQGHHDALSKGLKGAMVPNAHVKGSYTVFEYVKGRLLRRADDGKSDRIKISPDSCS